MSRKFLSSLLRSCATHSAVSQCHAQSLLQALLPNVILETDLLLAYSKLGPMGNARKLFDKMPERNMHSWNIMIASYAHTSMYSDALTVFRTFKGCCLRPDHYTLPPLFKISIGTGEPCFGCMCHGLVIKLGYEDIVVVTNSVLEFYVKCGTMSQASSLFSNPNAPRDSATWNLMISGFGKAGLYSDAVHCFRGMLQHQIGMKVDYLTLPSILSACGKEGDLLKVKEVHGFVVRNFGFDADAPIGNALIDNYGKCGCLKDSEKVFRTMRHVNLVTWTTMISCYGMHGKGEESVFLFEKMMVDGFRPNAVTFTAILASCSHSGLVDQGKKIFSSMNYDYGFEPTAEHYACMVDLFGRCGCLEEALQLLERMKQSFVTGSMWGALLAGCVMHKNVEIGEVAAQHLFQLEPNNTSNYVALCGIYQSCGMVHGFSTVKAKMRELGLNKTPGCSWINIAGRAHKFYQGDLSHPLAHMICKMIHKISNTQVSINDLGIGNLLHDDASQSLSFIQSIQIRYCDELDSLSPGGLPTPNLIHLGVYGCNKLHSLPEPMNNLVGLQELRLYNLPNLQPFANEGLPINLRKLSVGGIMWNTEWSLEGITCLSVLEIGGGDIVNKLMKMEVSLLPASLMSLHIYRLDDIQCLNGKWLHHFTSLQNLEISDAPNLKSLPEEGLPSSLSVLSISDCPLLEANWRRKQGKEWRKISHIPCILIDHKMIT